MKLQQFIDLDRSLIALNARLGAVLEPDARATLDRLSHVTGELRHFAVRMSDAATVAHAGLAGKQREDAVARLVQTFTPS